MEGSAVFRLISVIPDRVARTQSGTPFDGKSSDRAEQLARFLGWLGPLNPIGKEEQQLLGLRGGAARPMADEDEHEHDPLGGDDGEEPSNRQAEAGTQVAL
jgi:hypothetical protein